MSYSFQKFAGVYGILAGITGLAYLVLFITLKNPALLLPSLMLLLTGLFASAVLVELYMWVRAVDEGFALWGLLLGILGAAGAAIHAAFDVANNFNPPGELPQGVKNLPSAVDPRGFLAFAVAGLAAIVLSWLIIRSGVLSRALGYFGVLSGLLLIALYLAYAMLLNAAVNPIVLGLILLSGLAQPIWYAWLGFELWRGQAPAAARR